MQGSINFAGEVFPRMRNWTAGNRATSVGNQLHCNYRKFLLAYECAHAPRDLGTAQPLLRQVCLCCWFFFLGLSTFFAVLVFLWELLVFVFTCGSDVISVGARGCACSP